MRDVLNAEWSAHWAIFVKRTRSLHMHNCILIHVELDEFRTALEDCQPISRRASGANISTVQAFDCYM
jgi:hypothetical protein